jgi:hypothetical protein
MAERHDLTLTMGTRPGCPWPEGFYLFRGEGDILERCQRLKEDLYDRVLPGLRPDLIIAMDAGPDPDTDVTKPTPPGRGREYHDAVLASVPKLASFATHVVLLDPLPKSSASRDPAKCLRTARYTEACRFRANAAPTWMEVLDRQAVERADNVEVLDIDRLACPLLPLCDPVVGGRYVWRDSQHLTQAYGRSLGEPLYQQLVSAGALPG